MMKLVLVMATLWLNANTVSLNDETFVFNDGGSIMVDVMEMSTEDWLIKKGTDDIRKGIVCDSLERARSFILGFASSQRDENEYSTILENSRTVETSDGKYLVILPSRY